MEVRKYRWQLVVFTLITCVLVLYYSFVLLPLLQTSPEPAVYNQRIAPKQAEVIARALNKYFQDHREYPYQVYGGSPIRMPAEYGQVVDPLLHGGYLKQYPRSKVVYYHLNKVAWFDYRGTAVKNLVSAPHDALVEQVLYMTEPAEPAKPSIPSWDDEETRRKKMQDYEARLARFRENHRTWEQLSGELDVLFAAGGVKQQGEYGTIHDRYGIVFPEVQEQLESYSVRLDKGSLDTEGIHMNFGYVRGDRMESDKTSAFLWMYGILTYKRSGHSGLDLLNAETGELKPDGIPDGICILYELRDDEVVNITRAEDM